MTIQRIISEMQQSDSVVHVVQSRTARRLLDMGLVRRTVVKPPPTEGVAVNLTVTGKSFGRGTTEVRDVKEP